MSFLAGPAGRWLVILAVALVAMLAAYWHGREHEQGIVAEARLKDEQEFTKRLLERAAKERSLHAKVAKDLEAERGARAKDRISFERKLAEVPRETLVEVCRPGAVDTPSQVAAAIQPQAAYVPRLTRTACGLWNDALAAGATASERAGWLAGANPCADSAASR